MEKFFCMIEKKLKLFHCFRIENDLKTYIINQLNTRWDLISSNVHSGCYLIDPRFSQVLEQVDINDGIQYFKKIAGNLWENNFNAKWIEFCQRKGPFSSENWEGKIENPTKPWNTLKSDKNYEEYHEFCDFAIEILQIAATTCAVERSFSKLKNIHSRIRNRLGPEKVNKLLYINYNSSKIIQ